MADEFFEVKVRERADKVFLPQNVGTVTLRRTAAVPDQAAAEAHVAKHCLNLEVLPAEAPKPVEEKPAAEMVV